MLVRLGYEISISCQAPVPLLMALSVHTSFEGRIIGKDTVRSSNNLLTSEYVDRFGNRITRATAPAGQTTFWSDFVAEISDQPDHVPADLRRHRVEDLPDDVLHFVTPSRFCNSDKLACFAWSRFGHTHEGWPRVQAISDFVHGYVEFGYKYGRPDKCAEDTLEEGRGVCRDFAHLAIALCRAMNIPARYATGYLGDIGVPDAGPDDFCAWFEVFLEGSWHTWDARYNVPRIGRVLMARGQDASDVAMITSFGTHVLDSFRVWVIPQDGNMSERAIHDMLQTRPGPKYPAPPTVLMQMNGLVPEFMTAGS